MQNLPKGGAIILTQMRYGETLPAFLEATWQRVETECVRRHCRPDALVVGVDLIGTVAQVRDRRTYQAAVALAQASRSAWPGFGQCLGRHFG